MDIGTTLYIKFRRGEGGVESFNLKKYVEMEEANKAERISAFDSLEEDASLDDADF
ncbi:hypothetical protein RHMOL_Rhmol07G0196300 [Rhododendron molle]|uniref:Uncharacterized protein n=1 Tax=Rhododendron molle TaxID=49168 RepID=A0ACC0N3K6_RHOML|nr:hypothetical protein RHMOL_Rhmol07G0196300 [Rhododendron molle]